MVNFIHPSAVIIRDVKFGDCCSVWPGAVIRGDKNSIRFGNYCNVQDNVIVHTDHEHKVEIGDYVSLGHGCIVHGCKIGNNVIIGMGAIILTGAEIPDNVIIGAGALVTENKELEPNSVYVGVPARKIRDLKEGEEEFIRENALTYWKLAQTYLKGDNK